jgi:hypothetical protein
MTSNSDPALTGTGTDLPGDGRRPTRRLNTETKASHSQPRAGEGRQPGPQRRRRPPVERTTAHRGGPSPSRGTPAASLHVAHRSLSDRPIPGADRPVAA